MGNICRSPAAEIIFTHLIERAGLAGRITCDSAGTIGHHSGNPPDPRMTATLERRGYRSFGRSRRIRRSDLDEFDHILVADSENLADVLELDPEGRHHAKIRILTDHCATMNAGFVPDPYYGGPQGFEHVADLVEDACRGLLETILGR